MSTTLTNLESVAQWTQKLWSEAVAIIEGDAYKIDARPPRLEVATDEEKEKHSARAIVRFEVTGDDKFSWIPHHVMSGILKKLEEQLAQTCNHVVGTNCLTESRMVVRTGQKTSGSRSVMRRYIDQERYITFMIYLGERKEK